MDYSRSHVNIDLHTHSTASDGTCTPVEIIHLASKLNLGAVSITDHDTLAGVKKALGVKLPSGLAFLPGIEISCAPPSGFEIAGSIHILGYGLCPDHPELCQTLETLQNNRNSRNPQIVAKLNALGIAIRMDDITSRLDPGQQLGRPHIAAEMVRKGIVENIDAAFDRFLANGRPAYVDKKRISSARAIGLIHAAGGIAVVAHPGVYPISDSRRQFEFITALVSEGLQGIEVLYPEHSAAETQTLTRIAQRLDLLITGGTDFHGQIKDDVQLGIGQGDFKVPYQLYEALVQRLQKTDA